MKATVQRQHTQGGHPPPWELPFTVADVASTIAKGNPPQWLPLALEHFSPGIGAGPSDTRHVIEKMTASVDVLLRFLPVFEHLPFGLAGECKDVRTVLALLPGIKKDLERGMRKRTRLDVRKIVCAAVMIEAWKLFHGNVEPHSGEFREACGQYWKACGGKEIGDAKRGNWLANWRRPIENALAMDREWIRKIMVAIVQNAH